VAIEAARAIVGVVATWSFEDGSELETGGIVRGDGSAAVMLTLFLERADRPVEVAPVGMSTVQLDPASNYLLDVLARDFAYRLRQTVRTDYVVRDEDIPAEVKELFVLARRSVRNDPAGTVY
jgi:hypothetical protein